MPEPPSTEERDALAAAPQPGSVFAEKYVIERILGVGGMGYVLGARHLHLDERVAIKMLLPKLANDPQTVARFLQEGRAAVKIQSEHVGRVLDVGSSEGTPFIVMEYLDGTDLAGLIDREERLESTRAVDYVLQACEAIAEAHSLRIVHRDLKPANLFLIKRPDGQECVKVLDFGISKMTALEGSGDLSMTKTSSVLGSPLYMSPEQLKSAKNVDERTDIWALGVILFELLAGRPPFQADSLAELGALVLGGLPPDVREFAPETPPGLAAAITACLQRKAQDRFPSVAELAATLAPFGSPDAMASAGRAAAVLQNTARLDNSGSWAAIASNPSLPPPPASAPIPSKRAQRGSGNTWASATEPDPNAKTVQAPAALKQSRTLPRVLAGAGVTVVAAAALLGGKAYFASAPPAPAPVASPVTSSAITASGSPVASASMQVPSTSVAAPDAGSAPPVATKPRATATSRALPSATVAATATSVTPAPSATATSTSSYSHSSKE